ncbi:DMT family transporter [Dietzia sp.]|uniref:DMT family transporter n=1 Tax=Dietzia sp. TaxID=1871616 RepID=UPI002FD9426E
MTSLALLCLVCAIVAEVSGTVSLRMATTGPKVWWIAVGAGYIVAFTMLSITLAQGMPLGAAYGIWAAAGVAITAILGRMLFSEPLTWVMGVGIVLIMGGVLLIELGAAH